MPDPNLVQPTDDDYYRFAPTPPGGWKPRIPSADVLLKSLDTAHDNIRKLVKQNDEQRATILRLESEIYTYKLWFRLQWGAIVALAGTLGWVIKFLLPYAIHGMAK